MLRALGFLVGLTLATLAGCSSSQLIDDLPGFGLPAGAPARPAVPYQYPAVHDMPPPRATKPLSAEEQLKMEEELEKLRNRQEGRQPNDKAPVKKPANRAKKKPAGSRGSVSTGAKPNP